MKKFFVLSCFLFLAITASAQQMPSGYGVPPPPQVQALASSNYYPSPLLAGFSIQPWFFTNRFTIKQDQQPDIVLSEVIKSPREFTGWQFELFAEREPIRITYNYLAPLRTSGQGLLPASLIIGNTLFGPVTTNSVTTNNITYLEAKASRHRIEFAIPFRQASSGITLTPRFAANFIPYSISARTLDSKTADGTSGTASYFTAGIALDQYAPPIVVSVAGDLAIGQKVNGYDLDVRASLIPPRRNYPLIFGIGYRIETLKLTFNNYSIDSDTRGPYFLGELRF